jgi:xanthine dehydrogenase accessory factor
MMLAIAQQLVQQLQAGSSVALCVLVKSRGSTPQEQGAKMLVTADGKLHGTLGGGCVEAEVRWRALELLHVQRSELLTFRLDHDYGWDDGLICGGTMEIAVQIITPAQLGEYQQLATQLQQRQAVTFEFTYQTESGPQHYTENLEPRPTLIIAGAGHVGQALARLATELEFAVVVIDDRAEFAASSRFPTAQQLIVGDIDTELKHYQYDATSYIVIVTRGHKHDGQALHAVLNTPAKYIGLIGSQRKIATIMRDLVGQGATLEQLTKVHAPIGLEINAVTVPEIAVSIAAEMIAVRRGLANQPALPMKLNAEQLMKLINANFK